MLFWNIVAQLSPGRRPKVPGSSGTLMQVLVIKPYDIAGDFDEALFKSGFYTKVE